MNIQFQLHRNMSAVRRLPVFILTFIAFNFGSANSFSIGTVSDDATDDKHVDKRAADPALPGDIFPDWVPFKNKHGDELGQFVDVPKAKLRKRLALPLNFKLRSVAEPQDDYFDKVQSEGDEDYFENNNWNSALSLNDNNKEIKINAALKTETQTEKITILSNSTEQPHKDISDIEGVVGIIQNSDPNLVALEDIITNANNSLRNIKNYDSKEDVAISKEIKLKDNNDEDSDYDEIKAENLKEEKENDAKKKLILNSVDQLKERHANEQKYISEKAKEEERFIEELQRDTIWSKNKNIKRNKYPKPLAVDYHDDYDEDIKTVEDKYQIKPRLTTLKPSTTTIKRRTSSILNAYEPVKKIPESAKLSVFRNPRLYMVYDDEDETEAPYRNKLPVTTTIRTRVVPKTTKYSSRYVTTTSSSEEDNTDNKKNDTLEVIERTAFVPDKKSDNGEPTLFFPERRKIKRQKTTTTTVQPVTISDNINDSADITSADTSASGSTKLVSNTIPINFFANPSIDGTASTGTASDDLVLSSTPDFLASIDETAPEITYSDSNAIAASGPSSSDATASSGEQTTSSGSETAPSSSSIEVADESFTTERARNSTRENFGETKNLTDLDASSTNKHKKEDIKEKGGDHEHESGGGKKYYTENEEEHGEHGKKAYENISTATKKSGTRSKQNTLEDDSKQRETKDWTSKTRFKDEVLYRPNTWYYLNDSIPFSDGHHKDTKGAKGHHDKEDHHGNYHDHGGHDKHRHDESGHYGEHHHEERGKKHAKYEESGKHSKGHSTKGSHDIHKKDEYEKKVEFFEEEGDSAEEEKHGGFNQEQEHKKGGKFKNGKVDADTLAHHKGHSGHFVKGGHAHGHKGHKEAGGHDSHGKHAQEHFEKEEKAGGKKWVYHHGYPAKNANLIVIDRRQDQLQHGPWYYG